MSTFLLVWLLNAGTPRGQQGAITASSQPGCESWGTLQSASCLGMFHQNKNCQEAVNEGQKALGEAYASTSWKLGKNKY